MILTLMAYKAFFYRWRQGRAILSPDLLVLAGVGILFHLGQTQWGYRAPTIFHVSDVQTTFSWISLKNIFRYLNMMFFPMQMSPILETAHPLLRLAFDLRTVIRVALTISILSYSFFGFVFGSKAIRFFLAWTYITLLPFNRGRLHGAVVEPEPPVPDQPGVLCHPGRRHHRHHSLAGPRRLEAIPAPAGAPCTSWLPRWVWPIAWTRATTAWPGRGRDGGDAGEFADSPALNSGNPLVPFFLFYCFSCRISWLFELRVNIFRGSFRARASSHARAFRPPCHPRKERAKWPSTRSVGCPATVSAST